MSPRHSQRDYGYSYILNSILLVTLADPKANCSGKDMWLWVGKVIADCKLLGMTSAMSWLLNRALNFLHNKLVSELGSRFRSPCGCNLYSRFWR